MNCLILTYFLESTMAVDHLVITQRRVQFATWEVGQQSSWFQQEHSVRTAGPHSTLDILGLHTLHQRSVIQTVILAPATFAGTRHRRSQLVERHKTKHWSTLLKLSVDHCHVQSTPLGESWPVLFAPSDKQHEVTHTINCHGINDKTHLYIWIETKWNKGYSKHRVR